MVSDVSRRIVLSRAAITGGEWSRSRAAPLTEKRSCARVSGSGVSTLLRLTGRMIDAFRALNWPLIERTLRAHYARVQRASGSIERRDFV